LDLDAPYSAARENQRAFRKRRAEYTTSLEQRIALLQGENAQLKAALAACKCTLQPPPKSSDLVTSSSVSSQHAPRDSAQAALQHMNTSRLEGHRLSSQATSDEPCIDISDETVATVASRQVSKTVFDRIDIVDENTSSSENRLFLNNISAAEFRAQKGNASPPPELNPPTSDLVEEECCFGYVDCRELTIPEGDDQSTQNPVSTR